MEELGPLPLVSTFRLEEINGQLANLAHGTRHAGLQIASNLSIVSDLARKIRKLPDSAAKSYCEYLLYKWKRLNIPEIISSDLFVIGGFDDSSAYCAEIEEKLSEIYSDLFNIQIFSRLYKTNMIYVASCYNRGSRDSSIVKYTNRINETGFGEVLCFVKVFKPTTCEPDIFAYIKNIRVANFSDECDIRFIFRFVQSCETEVIPVRNLQTVCFKANTKSVYISVPLNKHELE